MKNLMIGTLISIVLALVIGVIVSLSSYITYANYGHNAETSLQAKLNDNQQLLGKHSTQIAEMAQVNDMYKNDLKEVYVAAIQGRYGDDGSTAVMQWIKENNPNMDSTLYVRLSQKIEANRDEFANAQRSLIDEKRSYQAQLGFVWSGFWLRLAGYPKINLDNIKIITSTHSNNAYATGVDDGIQLHKQQ
jgi:type II secretory pathway component PulJ